MRGNFTTQVPDLADVMAQISVLKEASQQFLDADDHSNFKGISTLLGKCDESAHLIRSYLEYSAPATEKKFGVQTQIIPAPIKVTFEDHSLHVFTPLTFERGMPDSYILAKLVRTELQKYQEKVGFSLFWKLEPPLAVVILRRAQKYTSRLRDNDNMETGRIINTVFPELGLSDNCKLVPDIHSGFRIIDSLEEEGMEFIVFSQKHAKEHFRDLFAASSEKELMTYK